MRAALYLVSADRRDDVADGRVLGREHYCRDATESGATFAIVLAQLADRHVVRAGDVALRLVDDESWWDRTDGGRVLTPSGWRELTPAELDGFRCRTDGCETLADDSTGPALLCESCADAKGEAEERATYEAKLVEARKQYPHACEVCCGSGFRLFSYDPDVGCDPCDACVEAGRCPRCASPIELKEHAGYDYERCTACEWDERLDFETVLPISPF